MDDGCTVNIRKLQQGYKEIDEIACHLDISLVDKVAASIDSMNQKYDNLFEYYVPGSRYIPAHTDHATMKYLYDVSEMYTIANKNIDDLRELLKESIKAYYLAERCYHNDIEGNYTYKDYLIYMLYSSYQQYKTDSTSFVDSQIGPDEGERFLILDESDDYEKEDKTSSEEDELTEEFETEEIEETSEETNQSEKDDGVYFDWGLDW